jgi:hypothetical protein
VPPVMSARRPASVDKEVGDGCVIAASDSEQFLKPELY